ncbi:hypothetical protein EHO58_01495 [Leptospira selangorensis]|uniref:hypothetical protein n=1 Tax=Leptospira selangorensis TaxID=2484982 RepID=UPI001083253D|nr:hypothetical protein [Leptospira selangorensis]TGK10125.1 hypothetical protein EHO58_01495 [Leptospira selangorensis]
MSKKNYLQIIEETIDKKLDQKVINGLTGPEIERIAYTIDAYVKDPFIPTKSKFELRPFFSYEVSMGDHFVQAAFVNGEDLKTLKLFSDLKRTLLYSESICFYDPLVYHLDFFRPYTGSEFSERRINSVKYILNQYIEAYDLFEKNILIPISYDGFRSIKSEIWEDIDNIQLPIKTLEKEYKDQAEFIRLFYLENIKKQLKYKYMLNNQVDIVLPDDIYLNIYKMVLREHSKINTDISGHRFNKLFCFNKYQIIDTDNLEIKHITNIRNNEEAFSIIRNSINNSLNIINDPNTPDNLKLDSLKLHFEEDLDKYSKEIQKSQYLKTLTNLAKEEILIGGIRALTAEYFLRDIPRSLATGFLPSLAKLLYTGIAKKPDYLINNNFLSFIKK